MCCYFSCELHFGCFCSIFVFFFVFKLAFHFPLFLELPGVALEPCCSKFSVVALNDSNSSVCNWIVDRGCHGKTKHMLVDWLRNAVWCYHILVEDNLKLTLWSYLGNYQCWFRQRCSLRLFFSNYALDYYVNGYSWECKAIWTFLESLSSQSHFGLHYSFLSLFVFIFLFLLSCSLLFHYFIICQFFFFSFFSHFFLIIWVVIFNFVTSRYVFSFFLYNFFLWRNFFDF